MATPRKKYTRLSLAEKNMVTIPTRYAKQIKRLAFHAKTDFAEYVTEILAVYLEEHRSGREPDREADAYWDRNPTNPYEEQP